MPSCCLGVLAPVGDVEGRVTQLPRHSASPFETRRQLGRFGWLSYALLVTLPALVVVLTLPMRAREATREKLVVRPGAGEFQPIRGNNFIAWQQNTHRNRPTTTCSPGSWAEAAPSAPTRAG
jgi:hypothetical protein